METKESDPDLLDTGLETRDYQRFDLCVGELAVETMRERELLSFDDKLESLMPQQTAA